jgi:tRNA pseudouridine13 synthase
MTIRKQPEDFIVRERLADAFRASLRSPGTFGGADEALGETSSDAGDRSRVAPRFAVYEVAKTSRTTPEVAQELAKALKIKPGAVEYAGLKDKHAGTVQHMTAAITARRGNSNQGGEAGGEVPAPVSISGRMWDARLIGWVSSPINADAIDGNSFRITVRDLARETCAEMDRRAGLLRADGPAGSGAQADAQKHPGAATPSTGDGRGGTLLFVNYFGSQRFGSARHGGGFVAAHLIRGEFEQALKLAIATPARKDAGRTRIFTRTAASGWGDWKRLAAELPRCPERAPIEALANGRDFREAFTTLPYFLQAMYVEAYQSHLWNRTAHALGARLAGGADRCLRSDDEYGEMLFPAADRLGTGDLGGEPGGYPSTGRGARSLWSDLDVPILSATTNLIEPWADAARGALDAEGISIADLRIPGLRRPFFGEASRRFVSTAEGFRASRPEHDELSTRRARLKRVIEFDLPRGSYATVVLRALGQ